MAEIYRLPQGKIIIGFSDKKVSIGLLELNPKQELVRHNRPVAEELTQICGNSTVKLLGKKNSVREVNLKAGDILEIPANQFHIHSNASAKKSITLWKFQGDIVSIIDGIRNNYKRIL